MSGLEERISTPQTSGLIEKLHAASVTVLGNRKRILPFHYSADTLTVISIGVPKSDEVFVQELAKYGPVINFRLTKETNDSVRRRLYTGLLIVGESLFLLLHAR